MCEVYRLPPSIDYGMLSHPKDYTYLIPAIIPWQTHTLQMPISAQQWRVAVGQVNAYRSLRPHVTGQPKMKLTSLDVLLFILTALLGATLSGDGGGETGEKSE